MFVHPYFFIDRHIIAFGEYEAGLQRLMERSIRPGMTCLDVGANIGAITIPMARLVGPQGKVVAFEPNPPIAERLNQNVSGNSFSHVRIESCALSDEPGNLVMATASPHHENQGMSSLVEFSHGDLTSSVTVPVRTLDEYVAAEGIQQIDFIKVDIQGAEPQFLKGAAQTIRRFQPTIVMELAASSLADSNTTAADIVRQLNELGLQGFELSRDGRTEIQISAASLPADYVAENAVFYPETKFASNP